MDAGERFPYRRELAMHAWDCSCGTRNAPTFAVCRNCGRPAGQGWAVDSPLTQPSEPPSPLQPPAPQQKTDLCAVLADVFGILGLLLFPIVFGPAAIALGAVSFWRLNDNPTLKGHWQAGWGLALGVLCTLIAASRLNP